MNKAKQVVETWDKQFHCSPREQRLAYLYLANDILQNSRRKGSEFVGEFWKVLPHALRDVIGSGDEFGRNAALRLVHQCLLCILILYQFFLLVHKLSCIFLSLGKNLIGYLAFKSLVLSRIPTCI